MKESSPDSPLRDIEEVAAISIKQVLQNTVAERMGMSVEEIQQTPLCKLRGFGTAKVVMPDPPLTTEQIDKMVDKALEQE